MLHQGMWTQVENIIVLTYQIQCGNIIKDLIIQRIVSKVYKELVDENFMKESVVSD